MRKMEFLELTQNKLATFVMCEHTPLNSVRINWRMESFSGKISNQKTKNFPCVPDCKRSQLANSPHLPPYPENECCLKESFACF
jgi:hypothetical protein